MKESRKFGAKALVLVCVLTLAMCCAIGGTIAWLVDETNPVVNTFTYGDINIGLTETDTGDGDDNANTNEFKMMPGSEIEKDPVVTVNAGSEACWLFVKLDKANGFDNFMTYSMADGWIQLTEVADGSVWYRAVNAANEDIKFTVIKDNKVMVKDTVTKKMLNDLGTEYPTLTVTAYAVQQDNIESAALAWIKVQEQNSAADGE